MNQKEFEKIQDLNWKNWRNQAINYYIIGLCGEVGELANIAKKYHRWILGWQEGYLEPTDFLERLKEELADIQIYLWLIAGKYGLDLEKLVEDKMKENCRRFGWRML